MKPVLILVSVVIIVSLILWNLGDHGIKTDEQAVIDTQAELLHWTWQNPYTFKETQISAPWKQTVNTDLQDTVLTLQHDSGKSLIYLLYEEPVDYMTLPEYIDAMKPLNQKEFGIEDFQMIGDKDGNHYYEGESARYLGNALVGISVRIWSDGANSFWEVVQMTDMEYKAIEYNAKEVVKKIIETTL